MSPEQMSRGIVNKQADMYSFGMTIYEVCRGNAFWHEFLSSLLRSSLALLRFLGQLMASPLLPWLEVSARLGQLNHISFNMASTTIYGASSRVAGLPIMISAQLQRMWRLCFIGCWHHNLNPPLLQSFGSTTLYGWSFLLLVLFSLHTSFMQQLVDSQDNRCLHGNHRMKLTLRPIPLLHSYTPNDHYAR